MTQSLYSQPSQAALGCNYALTVLSGPCIDPETSLAKSPPRDFLQHILSLVIQPKQSMYMRCQTEELEQVART